MSADGADLIRKLLVINPSHRLGSTNIDDLKTHRFFDGIDFSKLHL